jgi:hypothetical protein
LLRLAPVAGVGTACCCMIFRNRLRHVGAMLSCGSTCAGSGLWRCLLRQEKKR